MKTKLVRDITNEEFGLYRKHADIVRGFSKEYELLRLVIRAFEAFKSFMSDSVEIIRISPELNQEALVDYSFEPGALILEYLNVTRVFVDHFRAKITRAFGKGSPEVARFEEILKSEFDEYFSYRFFYKLRNYTTHCGLPLFHFQLTRIPGSPASLIVSMKPEELLASYDGWGADVGRDLRSMESDIYVWPLLNENINSLYHVYHTLYGEIYRCGVLGSLGWLCDFLGPGSPQIGYAIATFKPDEQDPSTLEFVVARELKLLIETERVFLDHLGHS